MGFDDVEFYKEILYHFFRCLRKYRYNTKAERLSGILKIV